MTSLTFILSHLQVWKEPNFKVTAGTRVHFLAHCSWKHKYNVWCPLHSGSTHHLRVRHRAEAGDENIRLDLGDVLCFETQQLRGDDRCKTNIITEQNIY